MDAEEGLGCGAGELVLVDADEGLGAPKNTLRIRLPLKSLMYRLPASSTWTPDESVWAFTAG